MAASDDDFKNSRRLCVEMALRLTMRSSRLLVLSVCAAGASLRPRGWSIEYATMGEESIVRKSTVDSRRKRVDSRQSTVDS
jgi:hypothetical protein